MLHTTVLKLAGRGGWRMVDAAAGSFLPFTGKSNLCAVNVLERRSQKIVDVDGIADRAHRGIKVAYSLAEHVVAFAISGHKREAAEAPKAVFARNLGVMDEHAKSVAFILDSVSAHMSVLRVLLR